MEFPRRVTCGEGFWALQYVPPDNTLPPKIICSGRGQGTSDCSWHLPPQQIRHSGTSTAQPAIAKSTTSYPDYHSEISLLWPGTSSSSFVPALRSPAFRWNVADALHPTAASTSQTGPSAACLLSSTHPVSPIPEISDLYIAQLAKSPEREAALKRVIETFSRDRKHPDSSCYDLFSAWSSLELGPNVEFKGIPTSLEAEVAPMLCRLEQARRKILGRDCISRTLWLILVAHEVEYISQSKGIRMYNSQGVDHMSAALRIAKKYVNIKKQDSRSWAKVLQIITSGGPGSVLEYTKIAPRVWQRIMTLEDITFSFSQIRRLLPNLYEQIRSKDLKVTSAIMHNFQQYGWSLERFLDSNTKVAAALRPYIGMPQATSAGAQGRHTPDPNSMTMLVEAAEYVSGQDAQYATVPVIDGGADTAEVRALFSDQGVHSSTVGSDQPALRWGGGIPLFSEELGFECNGEYFMIDEEDPMISGMPDLRREGGIPLFGG